MGNKTVISVEEGLKRVVNNEKLYHRLLGKFSGRKISAQIKDAAERKEYADAANSCHALKGLASNLAMHPLALSAAALEERLKLGEYPEDLFFSLQEELDAVEKAIEEILAGNEGST